MYKARKQAKSSVRGLFLMSLLFSLGLILAVSLVMSAIAYSSPDPTARIGIYSLISLLISGAVAGIISARLCRGSVGIAALVALASALVMLIFGAIISGGALGGGAVMNYLCYLGVAVVGAFLGRKRERRRRTR